VVSQGYVERHIYSCYSVIPTHVHLSLNFPAKAHSTPSFSTPTFSTRVIWCRVFHSRVFHSRVFSAPDKSEVLIVAVCLQVIKCCCCCCCCCYVVVNVVR